MAGEEEPPKTGVTVSYGNIAAGATVIAVASVTALVILASVKNVDTLSAIALALAIVAFMVQIVVFIAQTWSTNQLNAETRSFLTELRTRSQGTEELLGKQVDKLTDDLMARATDVAKGASPAQARQRLRRDVERALGTASTGSISASTDVPRAESPYNVTNMDPARVARLAGRLRTFPDESDAAPLVAKMRSLSPGALGRMSTYAKDAIQCFTHQGDLAVPGFPEDPQDETIAELVNAGIFQDRAKEPDWVTLQEQRRNPHWFDLTEEGLELARLFVAEGPTPSYLKAQPGQPARS